MDIFIVPHLNEVEEGGVLDYPLSVCLSVRTGLVSTIRRFQVMPAGSLALPPLLNHHAQMDPP